MKQILCIDKYGKFFLIEDKGSLIIVKNTEFAPVGINKEKFNSTVVHEHLVRRSYIDSNNTISVVYVSTEFKDGVLEHLIDTIKEQTK